MNYNVIPLIDQHTDLDDFDEYEAHKYGWSNEAIRIALREIDRRECLAAEAKEHCFYCGDEMDAAGFCDNPDCSA